MYRAVRNAAHPRGSAEGVEGVEGVEGEPDRLVGRQRPALFPGLGNRGLVEVTPDGGQRHFVPLRDPCLQAADADLLDEGLEAGEEPGGRRRSFKARAPARRQTTSASP